MLSSRIRTNMVGLGLIGLLACGDDTTNSGGAGGSSTTAGGNGGNGGNPTTTVTVTQTTGTTMTTFKAACDAPATPPSNGSCYTPPPPPDPVCPGMGGMGGMGGAGGAGGATGGAGGATGGAGGAGGAPPPPDCSGIFGQPTACGSCIQDSCCPSLSACDGIPNCIDCFTGATSTGCDTPEITGAIDAVLACLNCLCVTECTNAGCNPVTGEPCDTAAGEACDISGNGGFVCYPAPNDSLICEECDESAGPYCANGMTCLDDGGCAKFCCDDGDCGSGHCDFNRVAQDPNVGVCVN